jgi:hypothetical protein
MPGKYGPGSFKGVIMEHGQSETGRPLPGKSGVPIIVVTGLPRSGTSLMMNMLEQGGVPLLTDGVRRSDEDNPRGYFEFEQVKQLRSGDFQWLSQARGRAVKVISALVTLLPPHPDLRLVFMRRSLTEVLASQRVMLHRRGKDPDAVSDRDMMTIYRKHLDEVETWLNSHPSLARMDVDYNGLMADPLPLLRELEEWIGIPLDLQGMRRVIDPVMYRQRADSGPGNPRRNAFRPGNT